MSKILNLSIVRFVIVGVASNLILYALFLCLIFLGVSNISGMTICYILGVCQTFYFNKNWSFKNSGSILSGFVKYVGLYLVGYFLNVCSLYILVHIFGYNVAYIQAFNIVVLALFFFVMQKYFVFKCS